MANTKANPSKKRKHAHRRYNPVKLDSGRKPRSGEVVVKQIEPYSTTEGLPFTAKKAPPRPLPRKQQRPPAQEHTPAERANRLEALNEATQRGLSLAREYRNEPPPPHPRKNLHRDLATTEATYRDTILCLNWQALTPQREASIVRSYRKQGKQVRRIILEAMETAVTTTPQHSATIARVLSTMKAHY